MAGGNNTITIPGSGYSNISVGNGNNTITISGSGDNYISVGNGNNTINLSGTSSGTSGYNYYDNISIGSGSNTITLGSGAGQINNIDVNNYYNNATTLGANTINNVNSNDSIVFSPQSNTINLLNSTLGTESTVSLATEITNLQHLDTAAGDVSVGWTTAAGNTYVVMDNNTGSGNVDQVIQIVGSAPYLTSSSQISNPTAYHLVYVTL
jgi:hypothetical protein